MRVAEHAAESLTAAFRPQKPQKNAPVFERKADHLMGAKNEKSILSLNDLGVEPLRAVLGHAASRRRDLPVSPAGGQRPILALVFEKPSLRTRVTLEVAMAQLGGHAICLNPQEVGLGQREAAPDVAAALSRWVDLIAVRVFRHETAEEIAAEATVPVINALSDREHPCQALADLLTIRQRFGKLGPHLKVAYVGDGNNVLHSLMLGCAMTGIRLEAACPNGFWPDSHYVAEAERIALGESAGAGFVCSEDPFLAVRGADVIYTDVWASMGQEAEAERRRRVFAGYQVNEKLLAGAKPGVIVMHCLPAHRGEEITDEVLRAHSQVIFDQAENRLHTARALLIRLLGLPGDRAPE